MKRLMMEIVIRYDELIFVVFVQKFVSQEESAEDDEFGWPDETYDGSTRNHVGFFDSDIPDDLLED